MTRGIRLRRTAAEALVLLVALVIALGATLTDACPAGADSGRRHDSSARGELEERGWVWPVAVFRLEKTFQAPAHRYGAGHRGIDLRPSGSMETRAPADGTVAFIGSVAGRRILTIDHGDGLVTTLEPIESALTPGVAVRRGDTVGTVSLGGHAAPGALHFGVRQDGEYINPLLLLGGVPRAVLLPCC